MGIRTSNLPFASTCPPPSSRGTDLVGRELGGKRLLYRVLAVLTGRTPLRHLGVSRAVLGAAVLKQRGAGNSQNRTRG